MRQASRGVGPTSSGVIPVLATAGLAVSRDLGPRIGIFAPLSLHCPAGVPGTAGDGGTIAAANRSQLVIATASAASWLYSSGNGAAQWQTVVTELDGGQGWADLGFTTASDGVVIHGPAARGFVGQLLLTADGGLTWRRVSF